MKQSTKELALCGVMTALSVVLLCLGGVIPLAVYACPMLASCALLVLRETCRARYAWCCWAAVALLTLLAQLRKFLLTPFSLTAITLDPCFLGQKGDYTAIAALCERLDVPYVLRRTKANLIFCARCRESAESAWGTVPTGRRACPDT